MSETERKREREKSALDKVYEMSCVSLTLGVSYISDQSALLFLIRPAISHSARIDRIRETKRTEPTLRRVSSQSKL